MKQITIGVTINLGNYESLRVDVVDECPDWAIEAIDDALQNVGRTDPDMCAAIDSFRKRAFADVPVLVRRTQGAAAVREMEEAIAAKTETTPEVVDLDPSKLPKVCDKCGVRVSEADAVASALHMRGVVRCLKCRYPGLEPKQTPPPETVEQVCVICGLSALNTGGLSAGGKCAACLEFDSKSEAAKAKPTQKSITPTQPAKEPEIAKPEPAPAAGNPTISNYVCAECGVEITKTQHDVSQLFHNRDLCKACMVSIPKERVA